MISLTTAYFLVGFVAGALVGAGAAYFVLGWFLGGLE